MAPCVSDLRLMLAISSGGSMLMLAMALAVMPASNGPWRAATTVTPVAKRAIICAQPALLVRVHRLDGGAGGRALDARQAIGHR